MQLILSPYLSVCHSGPFLSLQCCDLYLVVFFFLSFFVCKEKSNLCNREQNTILENKMSDFCSKLCQSDLALPLSLYFSIHNYKM